MALLKREFPKIKTKTVDVQITDLATINKQTLMELHVETKHY